MTRAYHLTTLIKGFAHFPFYTLPSHIGNSVSDALARWVAFHFCAHAVCNTRLKSSATVPLLTDLSVRVKKEWEKHNQEIVDINYAGMINGKGKYYQVSIQVNMQSPRSFVFQLIDKTLIHQFSIKGIPIQVGNTNIFIQDQFTPAPLAHDKEDEPKSWPRRGLK